MAGNFAGKVITVTGAASGMGLATAKLLASRGATLSLADLNEAGLKTAIESLPGDKHIYTALDVRKSAAVDAWIERTVKEVGQLDGAVNMAGVLTYSRKVVEETDEGWAFNMDVNSTGVFYCVRAQLRHMKAGASIVRSYTHPSARFRLQLTEYWQVSTASVAGQIGYADMAAYCASKHAVIGLVRTAAKENPHIRLNCVAPGVVNTPMMVGADIDREVAEQVIKRLGEPEEISRVIAFLLSDEASFVTGAVYNVDGGWFC
ncbi:Levodione reductase [Tolypocladium ophioglossoides CBS 100239]|uniref:Levodione reductase n=1 Tax=Tolypocladium ophioglossoides (strain CBS 100239) TaxID=1163406 RepID=A0A0L0NH45_TOLOC|nr:Levodione reductase [Tolypocladium ophioglossoides CBS 100239]